MMKERKEKDGVNIVKNTFLVHAGIEGMELCLGCCKKKGRETNLLCCAHMKQMS